MKEESYKILAVDDHPVVLEGIRMVVTRIEGVECAGLTNITDLKLTLLSEDYDMYILDLEFPDADGFCVVNAIRDAKPQSRIIIYTMHEEPWVLAKLLDLKIDGVISKSAGTEELCKAVNVVRGGGTYFNEAFLDLTKKRKMAVPSKGNIFELSERETEVLRYLSEGMSTNQIAEAMFLSKNTIQTYRKRLMVKLKAKNVAELMMKGKDLL